MLGPRIGAQSGELKWGAALVGSFGVKKNGGLILSSSHGEECAWSTYRSPRTLPQQHPSEMGPTVYPHPEAQRR